MAKPWTPPGLVVTVMEHVIGLASKPSWMILVKDSEFNVHREWNCRMNWKQCGNEISDKYV